MRKQFKSVLFKPIASVVMGMGLAVNAANAADKPAASPSGENLGSIGVLDVNRIITESKAAKALNTQMEVYRATYQSEISKREKALREKEATLVNEQKNLSPNEFEKKRKDFEKQVADLQKTVLAKDSQLKNAGQAAMDQIRRAVVAVSQKVAQSRGFKLVLPASVPVYIAGNDKVDITNDVLANLDAQLPKVDVVVDAPEKKK